MQSDLFYETIEDALNALVVTLGGPKKVGSMMRPEKPADEAARWVRDCLNTDRREHFTPAQILWLLRQGRAAGFHGAMDFIAHESGYTPPLPRSAAEEEPEMVSVIERSTQTLEHALMRLHGLRAKPTVGTTIHAVPQR